MSLYEAYYSRPLSAHVMMRPEISGTGGAVSSNNPYATKAGLEILRKGGNAADAAVAVSLALGVVEPCDSGIGGGCFTIFYDGARKKYLSYDARGTAPAAASEDMFLGADGQPDPELTEFSGRPVAAPTMYRLYKKLLREHGSMSLEEVSEPAIRLARDGFHCGFFYSSGSARAGVPYCAEHFEGFSELYLKDGTCRPLGELIKNPALADTMEQAAKKGADWFYEGPIASEIAAAAQKYGGIITEKDIRNCRITERTPVSGSYREKYGIVSMAPPSSGGAHMIQMLNILENFDLAALGRGSADSLHIITETMKMMYADRSVAMGDPDFVKIDLDRLTSKAYARELAGRIRMDLAQDYRPTPGIEAVPQEGCTTNFTVMDRKGNMLSQTQTIRNNWGCGVVVPGRGFILNNNLADFSARAGSRTSQGLSYGMANAVRPGKTPLSSMMPSILTKGGEPFMTIGSAGGPRIISSILTTILNVLDYGLGLDAAVRAPSVCCLSQSQGIEMDEGFSPDTIRILESRGHLIHTAPTYGVIKGWVNGILRRDGLFFPASSFRAENGGGGVLLEDDSFCVDGINFET